MKTEVLGMKMFLAGKWVSKEETIPVLNPQDNSLITSVPQASAEDMLFAIEQAKEGFQMIASMPVHQRISILNQAAHYIYENKEK